MSDATPPAARTVRCPGCGGPSLYASSNPNRPFCSARCKNNDFSAWASEHYAVPADPASGSSNDDLPTPSAPPH